MLNEIELKNSSLVDKAIAEGIEQENCVVKDYRTTEDMKSDFVELLKTCNREAIPIEWVIDIADESNGWFYATAYHYNDITQMLHVMVPDKINPTFDGSVQLDYRTVHLIECIDLKSLALFNKIIRDSIVKVKWDIEYFDDNIIGEVGAEEKKWHRAIARYFIRMSNQLLIKIVDGEQPLFTGVSVDLNIRLLHCYPNRNFEDFNMLIKERAVNFTEDAEKESYQAMQANRLRLVRLAFNQLDKHGKGVIAAVEVTAAYDASQHPEVTAGRMTLKTVFNTFLDSFNETVVKDGMVTMQGFCDYFMDLGQSIDNELYFENLICNVWHLNNEANSVVNSEILAAESTEAVPSLRTLVSLCVFFPQLAVLILPFYREA